MKKLITIFAILTTFTLPTMAASSTCEIKARSQASSKRNFDYDNEIPQKYKDRISSIINSPVTTDIQGQCSHTGIFNCHPGDIYKECCPCADFLAEQQVKEEYVNDFVKEQCSESNNTNTKSSTITVTGTVLDDTNQPALGAVVCSAGQQVQGKCQEVNSDDGSFSLSNISKNSNITIQLLGYTTKNLPANENMGTIVLQSDATILDAVTVTANPCDNKKPSEQNATALQWNKDLNKCVPTKCIEPRYKLENNICVDQVGKQCSDDIIISGSYKMSGNDLICAAKTCKCGYVKQGDECKPWDSNECTNKPKHATQVYRTCDWDDTEICEVMACSNGYEPNADGDACEEIPTKCNETDAENLKKIGASKTGLDNKTRKCIALSCKCGYELENGACTPWPQDSKTKEYSKPCTKDTKPSLPENAKSGTIQCKNDRAYCKISECISADYKLDENKNKCDSLNRESCTPTVENATGGKYKNVNGKLTCVITDCSDGFNPNKDGTKCVPECECGTEYDEKTNKCVKWRDTTCNDTQKPKLPSNAATGTKKCDNKNKAYCEVTTCNDGYRVSDDTKSCTSTRGDACDADAKKIDNNATAGKIKKVGDKMTCIITACANGYDVNKDGTKCVAKNVLSKEDSQKRIDELSENAEKMRQKEQSTENKLLGAAGIGAVGIGGMQLASAASEQAADADAEAAMRAYLATFHCNYGGGKNIAGGERDVELPGGNELIGLYGEYVNLANDLKIRKAALGMRPGIESESILDSATSGLYDDIAIGKTPGAYTSLARALMDPNGADAAAWAAQKADTAQKLKTGAMTAGIGAVATLAGNLALNSGDTKREKSAEINAKFDSQRVPYDSLKKLEDDIKKLPPQKEACPSGTTGSASPNCTCNDKSKYFDPNSGICQSCPDSTNQTVVKNECICTQNNKTLWDYKAQTCIAAQEGCTPECDEKSNDHLVVKQNCSCDCLHGYTYNQTKKTCECTGQNKQINEKDECITIENNTITKTIEKVKEVVQNVTTNTTTETKTVQLPASSLFKIGKHEVNNEAKKVLNDFIADLNAKNSKNCLIQIYGYTDPIGTSTNNQELSAKRAAAVAQIFTDNKSTYPDLFKDIQHSGKGETNCTCGLWTIEAAQGKTRNYDDPDYAACKHKVDDTTLTGNARFAPCRRVEISAVCDQTTTKTTTNVSSK